MTLPVTARRLVFHTRISAPFLAWITAEAYAARQIEAYGILNRHNERIEVRTRREAVYLEILIVALAHGAIPRRGEWSRRRFLQQLANRLREARS